MAAKLITKLSLSLLSGRADQAVSLFDRGDAHQHPDAEADHEEADAKEADGWNAGNDDDPSAPDDAAGRRAMAGLCCEIAKRGSMEHAVFHLTCDRNAIPVA